MDEKESKVPEKSLDPFSARMQQKKEEWYSHVHLTEKQLTWIIRIVYVLLGITAVMIILDAAGVF